MTNIPNNMPRSLKTPLGQQKPKFSGIMDLRSEETFKHAETMLVDELVTLAGEAPEMTATALLQGKTGEDLSMAADYFVEILKRLQGPQAEAFQRGATETLTPEQHQEIAGW